jgi:hypothetical protein
MFLEGWVYVTQPFDLDIQDLPEAYLYYFLFTVKLLNDTLKLLRHMNRYECLNVIDDYVYDATYCENVNFMNV